MTMSVPYLIAVETIHIATMGGMRTIYAGTPVPADDPAVKANPGAFRAPEEMDDAPPVFTAVEQATAAPGRRRAIRRPGGR
jgi:hypothetical protein